MCYLWAGCVVFMKWGLKLKWTWPGVLFGVANTVSLGFVMPVMIETLGHVLKNKNN